MAIIKEVEIKVSEQGTQEAKQKMDGLNQSTIANTQANKQNEEAQKSLKLQYREAIESLQSLNEQYGANSKQAIEAAKRAADLKDKIEDANDAMLAFKGEGTFIATTKALSSVTSGLGAVEGAMNLLGAESEDVQKALLRVQSAMALSQGLEGLEDAGRSFNQLKIAITNLSAVQRINNGINKTATAIQLAFTGAVNTTSIGFKVLRGAIISTGLGALVVGVGLLISNFDKVKATILKVVPGLKAVGDTITGIVNSITDFVGLTSETDRILDKQKENAEKALKQNERYLKLNEHKLTEAQKREIELNNEHFQRLIDGEFTKEQSLKILREKTAKDRKEKLDEQNAIELEKQKEAQEKRNAKLEEQRQKEIDIANKKIEDEKQRQESILNINEEYAKKIQDLEAQTELEKIELEKQRAIEELDRLKATEEQKKNTILYYDQLTKTELEKQKAEQFEKDLEAKAKESEDEQLSFEERLALLDEREDLIRANAQLSAEQEIKMLQENAQKENEINEQKANREKELRQQVADATFETAGQTLDLVGQLAKSGSKLGKAVAVAEVIRGGIQGTMNAYTTAQKSPITALFPGYPLVQAGLAAAFSAVQLSKINSSPETGSGGASGGGQSAPPPPPSFNLVQGTGTNQIAESLATDRQPLKAYVVASEVTTQQSLERNIQSNASL